MSAGKQPSKRERDDGPATEEGLKLKAPAAERIDVYALWFQQAEGEFGSDAQEALQEALQAN